MKKAKEKLSLKPVKPVAMLMAAAMFTASCASTTVIHSNPTGAKVYLNGEPVGTTPYTHKDTKIVGSTTTVKLEKEGYESLNTTFSRDEKADVGAIIGGVFTLVPFLWTMKYNPSHTYELSPQGNKKAEAGKVQTPMSGSKAERLRELKQLLDENIINQDEYEKEKKKILESGE